MRNSREFPVVVEDARPPQALGSVGSKTTKRKVPPLRKIIRSADDLAPVGMTGLDTGSSLNIRIDLIRKTNDMAAGYNRRNFRGRQV